MVFFNTDAGIELDDVGKYTIKAVCKNDKGIYSDVVTCKYKTEAKAPIIRKHRMAVPWMILRL